MKPLVLFVGGCMDATTETLRRVYASYKVANDARQTVEYRSHEDKEDIIALINANYASYKQRVCLVGHSWGGSCATRAANGIDADKKVELLITLDPVGLIYPAPRVKPATVTTWKNHYVARPTWEFSDLVAWVGNGWRNVPCADENRPYGGHHADAERMFVEYLSEVQAIT